MYAGEIENHKESAASRGSGEGEDSDEVPEPVKPNFFQDFDEPKEPYYFKNAKKGLSKKKGATLDDVNNSVTELNQAVAFVSQQQHETQQQIQKLFGMITALAMYNHEAEVNVNIHRHRAQQKLPFHRLPEKKYHEPYGKKLPLPRLPGKNKRHESLQALIVTTVSHC